MLKASHSAEPFCAHVGHKDGQLWDGPCVPVKGRGHRRWRNGERGGLGSLSIERALLIAFGMACLEQVCAVVMLVVDVIMHVSLPPILLCVISRFSCFLALLGSDRAGLREHKATKDKKKKAHGLGIKHNPFGGGGEVQAGKVALKANI